LRQKLSSDPTQGYLGAYQTYNDPTLGPVFGAGNDLETYGSLEGGYSIQSSYGPGYLSSNVFGRLFLGFPIAGMEVYSLAPAGPVSAVPTPPGLVLVATGAVPLLGRRLRRRKSPATA
jgi:hypothetical protein